MIEFIKHFFGFCGEAHPNFFTIIIGTPTLAFALYKFKNIKWNKK